MAVSHTRLQKSYDHRLRDLEREVGDPELVAEFGVPRSTALGWLRGKYRPVVTAELLSTMKDDQDRLVCTASNELLKTLSSGFAKRTFTSKSRKPHASP